VPGKSVFAPGLTFTSKEHLPQALLRPSGKKFRKFGAEPSMGLIGQILNGS
jgi:hypothetical protein